MVFVTGDTHADFSKFNTDHFPEQKKMTKNDFVIICGDFGGVWNYIGETGEEKHWLDWFDEKPFTLLFVDGNHENFDRLLNDYPVVDFYDGKAHQIRESVFHLMRGYIFDIEGCSFFTFGGASSHDIDDGILDIKDYATVNSMVKDYKRRSAAGEMLRINHISWWKEELPNATEMKRGVNNLKKTDFKVDFVISHCLPQSVAAVTGFIKPDKETLYFEQLIKEYHLKFHKWFSGHYHIEKNILCQDEDFLRKYTIKYHQIERVL